VRRIDATRRSRLNVGGESAAGERHCALRFRRAAFAPSVPSAVRVVLGSRAIVLRFRAAAAAVLMFLRAAAFCLDVTITPSPHARGGAD
jgi:hypothetical protein